MKKTVIKEFTPTEVTLISTTKEVTITTDESHPFDYNIIEAIWEDVEI